MKQTNTQEEIKLSIGSQASEKVICDGCGNEVESSTTHTLVEKKKEIKLCVDCFGKLKAEIDNETRNPNLLLGFLGGLGAAIVGAIGWYMFTTLTEREIGYLAIGLGWLVGLGVYRGAGKKRGGKLQLMAVILTLLSLLVSEAMIMSFFVVKFLSESDSSVDSSLLNQFYFLVGMLSSEEGRQMFLPEYVKAIVSPIGLLIWGLGLYTASKTVQARKV